LILGAFDANIAIFIMPHIVMNSRPDVRHPMDIFLINIAMYILLFATGIVFLLAWWPLRDNSTSGKSRVIAAGLMNLLVSPGVTLLFLRVARTAGLWNGVKLLTIPAAFGVSGHGLLAFPNSCKKEELPSPAGPIQYT
jgi:hypothetical protein